MFEAFQTVRGGAGQPKRPAIISSRRPKVRCRPTGSAAADSSARYETKTRDHWITAAIPPAFGHCRNEIAELVTWCSCCGHACCAEQNQDQDLESNGSRRELRGLGMDRLASCTGHSAAAKVAKKQTARRFFGTCGPSGGLVGIDQEVVTLRGLYRQLPGLD